MGAGVSKAFGDAAQLEAVEARVQNLTRKYSQFIGIQGKATQAAEKFRISQADALGDLVNLASRLGGTGATLDDVVNAYEGFNTLLATNKVASQEAAGAQLQLFQALGEGKLFAQEFNSLASQTPQLLDELAKVIGKPRGELKKLAGDGQISSQALIQALKNLREQGGGELENTFKGAFGAQKEFNKALQEFSVVIGQELLPVITPLLRSAAELLKIFGDLPGPVKTAAVAVGLLGTAALIAGPALGKLLAALAVAKLGAAAAGIGKIALAVKGLGIAIKFALGPWGLLIAGLAAAGVAIVDYTNKQAKLKKLLAGESEDLKEYKTQINNTETALRQAEKRLDEMITSGYDHEESIIAQKKEIERLRIELKKLVAQEYKVRVKIEYENFLDAKDVMIENFSMDKVNAILKAGIDEDKDKPKGGGSKSKPRESRIPELTRERELQLQLTELNRQSLEAQLKENSALVESLKAKELVLQADKDIADIRAQTDVPDAEKELEIETRRYELEQDLDRLRNQTATRLRDEARARQDILQPLRDERELLDAKLAGTGEAKEVELQINAILRDRDDLNKAEVEELVRGNAERRKAIDLMEEQKEIIGQLVSGVGSELTGLFETLIEGTEDWNKELQNVLKSLSKLLLNAGLNLIGSQNRGNPLGQLLGFRANGGPVSAGSPYIVGEKGPELFTPSTSGNITPNSALGGNTVVNITVNENGGSSSTSQGDKAKEALALGRMVESSVVAIITREKRPGGILTRA